MSKEMHFMLGVILPIGVTTLFTIYFIVEEISEARKKQKVIQTKTTQHAYTLPFNSNSIELLRREKTK